MVGSPVPPRLGPGSGLGSGAASRPAGSASVAFLPSLLPGSAVASSLDVLRGHPLVPGGGPLHGSVPGSRRPGRLGGAGASAAALLDPPKVGLPRRRIRGSAPVIPWALSSCGGPAESEVAPPWGVPPSFSTPPPSGLGSGLGSGAASRPARCWVTHAGTPYLQFILLRCPIHTC